MPVGPTRELLRADRTYYVRTDGSDSNSGLANTPGDAWQTIQSAIKWVRDNLDFGGHTVTVQVGAGTYTAGLSLTDGIDFVGGVCLLQGDTTTPSNVLIAPSNLTQAGIQVTYPTRLSVGGFKIEHSKNLIFAMYVSGGAVVQVVGKMDFGAVSRAHVTCPSHGTVVLNASYNISGSTVAHLYTYHCGFIEYGLGINVTLIGTPVFTDFAIAATGGGISADGAKFSGAAKGSRYSAQSCGSIDSGNGGPNFFPGDSPGSLRGGAYI